MRLHSTLPQVYFFHDDFFSVADALLFNTALAAVACLRSLAGFGFPLFAPTMYKALGYGKGDTVLAAFAIAVGCPAYVSVFYFYYFF